MHTSTRDPGVPSRSRRLAVSLTALSTLVVALGYASAFAGPRGARAGAWLMALGVPGLVVSMMALGLLRRAPARRAERAALACTFVALAGAYAAGLLLPARAQSRGPTVLGFPLPAAAVIYGAGIPLLFLPFVYAGSFERERRDVEQLRARREGAPVPGEASPAAPPR